MNNCRGQLSADQLGHILRATIGGDEDIPNALANVVEWDVESSEFVVKLLAQLPNPRPFDPLRQCIDSTYRRVQQQSSPLAEEETTTSTTTPTTTTTTSKSRASSWFLEGGVVIAFVYLVLSF